MQEHSRPHLVVVEDDTDLRTSLCEYLQIRGFEVFQAASGAELNGILSMHHIDLAILDVNLPDACGIDLARILSIGNDIGIIMLTALRTREDKLRGYDGGADLYFTKPFDSEEIALAAANLVRRVQRKRRGQVEMTSRRRQAWTLDRKRQKLSSPDGLGISLSGKETLLLEFLAMHPEPIVPRMEVLRLAEPGSLDPFSRRLDVALGRLRTKALEAGIDLPIQAVRGAGLRLLERIDVL